MRIVRNANYCETLVHYSRISAGIIPFHTDARKAMICALSLNGSNVDPRADGLILSKVTTHTHTHTGAAQRKVVNVIFSGIVLL